MSDDATGRDAVATRPLIGPTLKAARTAQRRTLDDVAAEVAITKGYLSKLERDLVTASVSTLVRLCGALDIPIGALFDGPPVGRVVRAGEYPRIAFGGPGSREYALTPHRERRLQAILSEITSGGGAGGEPYELPTEVSFAYVLAGRLRVTFTGPPETTIDLAEGDAFTYDPSRRHTFAAAESGTRVLWVLAPALPS